MSAWLLRTLEIVVTETPSSAATSFMVTESDGGYHEVLTFAVSGGARRGQRATAEGRRALPELPRQNRTFTPI